MPGRDANLFALQASLAAAGRATIQPGMTSVDLPVRGFITTDDDGDRASTSSDGRRRRIAERAGIQTRSR